MNSKQNESLDTVILLSDYEETISESQKSKSTKNNHKKNSNNHSEKSSSNNSTTKSHKTSNINISQQIQVKNKDFQCVINLNTNVYKHKSRCREKSSQKHRSTEEKRDTKRNTETTSKEHKTKSRCREKSSQKHRSTEEKRDTKRNTETTSKGHKTNDNYFHKSRESRNKDSRNRKVPSCNRRSCWNSFERLQERSRRRHIFTDAQMLNENYETHEKKKKNTSRKKIMEQQNIAQHHPKINAKTPMKPIQFRVLLSPISPTPFQEGIKDDISYDEISSGSLDISKDVWKPRTYKHCRRHSKHCKHRHKHRSSKLDTLIKRTKERERKLVENSRNWFTSTPIGQEFSSADFPMSCSDIDMSLNSVSTILLESQPSYSCFQKENLHARSDSEKLSNIKEDSFQTENLQASCETVKLSNYQPSSPSSTSKEVYTPTKESIDYQLIKEEPKIKSEVYSPTHSPESLNLYYLNDVKKEIEIKPELLFPAELSPISKNNNDLNLGNKFSKIENVKTELMFS